MNTEHERTWSGIRKSSRPELLEWVSIDAALPDDDVTVLCWLEPSGEWFAGEAAPDDRVQRAPPRAGDEYGND